MLAGWGTDLVNVARGADPTWSMLAVRAGRLSQCWPGERPTWSKLAGWGTDLVNVARGANPCFLFEAPQITTPQLNLGDCLLPRKKHVTHFWLRSFVKHVLYNFD